MRSSRRTVPLATALVLGAALALLAPTTTLADCRAPEPIGRAVANADVVFVGTVVETANRGTWATVRVDEIWRGKDQPSTVLVKGGPPGNAATSVDRAYEVGVKYVFFPYSDADGSLADNSCTNTTQWTAELAALRPADARSPIGATPEASGFELSSVLVPGVVALVVAGLLVGVGLLARGRDAS